MPDPDDKNVISAMPQLFAKRAKDDASRRRDERQVADLAKEQAAKEQLEYIHANEDNTRNYSPLVQGVKTFHEKMLMTDGYFIDVHATANPDAPFQLFQVNEQNQGTGGVGYYLLSIDLTKTFSEQWPTEHDSLDAKAIAEIAKGKGMLDRGSMLMQHSRAVNAKKPRPSSVHDPDEMRSAVALMHTGGDVKVKTAEPSVG